MLPNTPASGYKVFAVALTLFAFSDVFGKSVMLGNHPAIINILRFILLFTITCFMLGRVGIYEAIHASHKKMLVMRGICQGCSGYLYFTAMSYIPLSIAASIFFCAPLFIVALSPFFLKEQVGLRQWGTVFLGLVGMLCLIRPSPEALMVDSHTEMFIGIGCALGAMCFLATIQIITRSLAGKEKTLTQMFYGNGVSLLISIIPACFALEYIGTLEFSVALPLLAMVVLATGGQMLFVQAFFYTKASDLAPLNYIQLAITIFAGILIFHEKPTLLTGFGMFLIFFAGTLQGYFSSRGLK